MSLLSRYPLPAFCALAYLITWALVSPLVLSRLGVLGPVPPAWHALGALGPALAALTVTRTVGGAGGVRAWWSGLWRWRAEPGGLLWTLASPLVLGGGAVLAVGLVAGDWPQWGGLDLGLAAWFNLLAVSSLAYAVGEEPGWRGFLLPRLRERHGPLAATLILAPVWAVWHLPFFVYRYADTSFPAFALGLLAGAVFLTFLYERTGGSVLACVVWHFLNNVVMVALQAVSLSALVLMNVLLTVLALGIAAAWLRRRPAPVGKTT